MFILSKISPPFFIDLSFKFAVTTVKANPEVAQRVLINITYLSKDVDDVVMLCKNPHSLAVWQLI